MRKEIALVSGALAAFAFSMAATVGASAQTNWPEQPVTVVIPWPAGGATDPVARLIFRDIETRVGQPFVLEFRAGAAGTIGAAATAKAAPDGYTIMVTSDSPIVTANFMSTVPYDPKTAFIPVAQLTYTPSYLAANANTPYNTFEELIDYAKANPNKVNAAFAGVGSIGHLNMSLIQYKTGVELNTVSYPGSGAQLADLMSGVADIGSGFPTGYLGAVQSGKLKFIAALAEERSPSLPDVPTTDESSYKGIYGGGWLGAFVPKGTPKEIVDKLNEELLISIKKPEIAEKIEQLGYTIITNSPEEFAEVIEAQLATVQELVDQGIFNVE